MKAICLERSCEWANSPTKNCLWPRGCPKGKEPVVVKVTKPKFKPLPLWMSGYAKEGTYL